MYSDNKSYSHSQGQGHGYSGHQSYPQYDERRMHQHPHQYGGHSASGHMHGSQRPHAARGRCNMVCVALVGVVVLILLVGIGIGLYFGISSNGKNSDVNNKLIEDLEYEKMERREERQGG